MSRGQCAFSEIKGPLFQFFREDLLCGDKIPPTADKLSIFCTATKDFRVASLPSLEEKEAPEAVNGAFPPPAPFSLFTAASAAQKFALSTVTAAAPLLRSLPNAKPQLSPAVHGSG